MHFLIISILCSVSVSVLLKLARQKGVDIAQAVAVSYPVAALCCWFFLHPDFANWNTYISHWIIFLALGIGLPLGFIVLGRAIELAGMVKTDAAQRLSLFLPIVAAFMFFGESLSTNKIIGIALALLALLTLLYWQNPTKSKGQGGFFSTAGCLFGVWLCYGITDILFKQMSKSGTAFAPTLQVAFILAAILITGYLFLRRTVWNAASILAGLLLGCLNFANILFYIRAHQQFQQDPSLVFAGMNLGVITLATIIGAFVFKEKINGLNAAGIVLAITAIWFLFYGSRLNSWLPGM
jgi:drug/metabolite transporter (DMT)-like permease